MADYIVSAEAATLAQDSRGLHVTSHNTYNSSMHLTPSTVSPCPIEQFRAWFTAAQGTVHEPEAMSVSTCTPDGIPSSRFVLLKDVTSDGFVFYTNYTSRKSQELQANPRAALALYWRETHQQVRVVGRVRKVDPAESAAYFMSRPVGSRLGAWASRQSSVVGEEEVAARLQKLEERFDVHQSEGSKPNADIPAPDFWGGWLVVPEYALHLEASCFHFIDCVYSEVEFWAGKPSRLHDRVRYVRIGNDKDGKTQWKTERLAP
jgi:pyridoxamine-phosphate oxidase